jgi:hypothetical protein
VLDLWAKGHRIESYSGLSSLLLANVNTDIIIITIIIIIYCSSSSSSSSSSSIIIILLSEKRITYI